MDTTSRETLEKPNPALQGIYGLAAGLRGFSLFVVIIVLNLPAILSSLSGLLTKGTFGASNEQSIIISVLIFLLSCIVIVAWFERSKRKSTFKAEPFLLQRVQKAQLLWIIRRGRYALRQNQDNATATMQVSSAYFHLGLIYASHRDKVPHAINYYIQALRFNPDNLDARLSLAIAYHHQDLLDKAVRQYTYAMNRLRPEDNESRKMSKDYIWTRGSRGWVYFDLQHYAQAIEDLTIVIEQSSALDTRSRENIAWAYYKRGEAHRATQHYDQAVEDFENAIRQDKKWGAFYDSQGKCYLLLNRIIEAQKAYMAGWKADQSLINNGWMAVWCRLSMCQNLSDNDRAEITQFLGEVIARDDENIQSITLMCIALRYWLKGEKDQALGEVSKAKEKYPGFWDAYFWRGVILANNPDRYEEALENIMEAVKREIPPVLLSPLQWAIPSDFYQNVYLPRIEPILTDRNGRELL